MSDYASASELCEQCGITTFPHKMCRCITCNSRHLKHLGCRRVAFCPQCCQTIRVHSICECCHCGQRHAVSINCRDRRATSKFRAALRGDQSECLNIGTMNAVCSYCGARTWPEEKIRCCSSGEIVLPTTPDLPSQLSQSILDPHVLKNIRAYNAALCMASVGHKSIGLPDGVFVLGGKTFHRIGSMLPEPQGVHSFAQIYVLDVVEASTRRIDLFGGNEATLQQNVLMNLHSLMLMYNPWIRQFVAAARSDVPHLVWRCIDDISSMHVGALVAEAGSRRDVVVQRCSGRVLNIHDGHALYHPLAYPLLFPLGTTGWSEDMHVVSVDHTRERKLSLTEWGRYYLMHRECLTHLQQCEKLTMEFFCDVFAQVESRQADFHRLPQQQSKYRAARVAAVEDQLHTGTLATEIGKPVVRLPSGFVGSARWYQQLYYDAMALPMRFGKPDLFITLTCNPHWPEIAAALPAGAKWKHHIDVVERVFMIKLRQFIQDIVKDEIFGEVKAFVYRIEWQARGLPHAHMLFILKDKILSARHIDSIVSAEVPDPSSEPELCALVATHMLHPMCDINVSYGCRHDSNGALCDCRRHFPKQMSPSTIIVADGYPMYMRRGRYTIKMRDGRIVTDNWVVPFNRYATRDTRDTEHKFSSRYLLKRYKCHINVEVCAHFRCFKYVYKYTFKMPDRTSVTIDEIDAYLAGRLLSVSEAVHRLLELPLHKEFPPVTRLDIHLPRQHTIVFDPTADEDMLMAQVFSSVSTLTAWFELNVNDPFARQFLYHEVPEHYVWKDKKWERRHNKRMSVGRIFNVSHHNNELFALRRLLRVVKGATSFEDLATVNGTLHSTFSAACMARGLFADDTELILAFMEIADIEVSVDKIRRMFASMLVHCAPTDGIALFNRFIDDLCEGSGDLEENVDAALLGIEVHMSEMRKSLADFGFKLPEITIGQKRGRQILRSPAMSLSAAAAERDRLLQLFTGEQSDALNTIIASIGSNNGINVFAVLASAGCGKTVFANGLAASVRSRGGVVMSVAASALAAMLLTMGSTAHSQFHIPIPANEYSICSLSAEERSQLKLADVIIWDECSMIHQHVADTVERSIRDIVRDNRPFGGKTVVFMGDFKQLLPVVRHGRGQDHTMQRCAWWSQVQVITFSLNWRAVRYPAYSAFLESVGSGLIETVNVPRDRIVSTYDAIIDAVYGSSFCSSNQILALTLETCAVVNKMCIDRLPGQVFDSPAVDSYVDCDDPDSYPPDYVESIHMNGAPPFMLQLKTGAKFMCIRNLNQQRGIINGTMLEVLEWTSRHLQARILTGKAAGSIEYFLKNVFTITPEASGLPFTIIRRQYPIIPAYCLSVHKAQGQTIKKCGLIFESDPFTHGQLYVALSRVSSWECLWILLHTGQSDIRNMVLKHLLWPHS
jgi:hypothetical protein